MFLEKRYALLVNSVEHCTANVLPNSNAIIFFTASSSQLSADNRCCFQGFLSFFQKSPKYGCNTDLCRATFSWWEALTRPIHLRGPRSHCYEETGKALFSLSLAQNDDVGALKVRSIKNSKSLLACPTITALVAAFDAKAFNDTELLKSYLVGGNRIINFCRQTNRKCHG